MDTGATLLKVRERGHWRVVIQPSVFDAALLPTLKELEDAAKSSVVQIRGWDYPHWPQQAIARMDDHIEAWTDWEDHKEVWRAYQSGLFAHTFAMREDWLAENSPYRRIALTPGSLLSYESTVYTFAEICLFASRWSLRAKLPGRLNISYDIIGLKGRQLQTLDGGRVSFDEHYKADLPSWHDEVEVDVDDLAADPPKFGLKFCVKLFERFKWDTTEERLREVLSKLERFRAL